MDQEKVHLQCPVCEYPRAELWCELNDRLIDRAESFPLFECSSCGLLFQDSDRVRDRLEEFYPKEYWWRGRGRLAFWENRYREWMVRHDHLRFLRDRLDGSRGPVLDIGTGSGLFVKMGRREGFEIMGIDSSDDAVEAAREANTEGVVRATEAELVEEGKRFYAITLFHVLEHLPDPFQYLKGIRKLIDKPGHLIVQVPNRASWQARLFGKRWYGLDCPRHLCNFSLYSLLYLLGRAGYRVQSVRHFSLRDNAPAIVSSLLPSLDPIRGSVRARLEEESASAASVALQRLFYFGLVVAAQPLAWVEAKAGRGGTVMVHATWD